MGDLPELRLELARLQAALAEIPRWGVAAPYGHGYAGVRRRFGFLLSGALVAKLDARCVADPGPTWRRLRSMVREFQLLDQVQEQTQSWLGLGADSPGALATREEAYCLVVQSTLRHRWERSWLAWEEEQCGGDYRRLRSLALIYAEALRRHQHPVDISMLPHDESADRKLMRLPAENELHNLRRLLSPIIAEWLVCIGMGQSAPTPSVSATRLSLGESCATLIRPGMAPLVSPNHLTRALHWIGHAGALLGCQAANVVPSSSPIEAHCAGDRSHLLGVEMLGRLAVTDREWLGHHAPRTTADKLYARCGQLLRAQVRTILRRIPVIIDALDDSTGWRDIPGRWHDPLSREPALLPDAMPWTQGLVRHGWPVPALRAWLHALAFREELIVQLGSGWAVSPKLGEAITEWYLDLAERDAAPDQLPRAWSALDTFLGLPVHPQ